MLQRHVPEERRLLGGPRANWLRGPRRGEMGGGVGTAAWPAASHWCVSRGWCRQLRFWLRVWSSQLGRRPWLAACPRGHSLHQNPREAGAGKKYGKTVGGALSNCKTGGLSRNDTYEAACPPSIVRARRARDTSGRTAQTRAQPGTGKQTQSQTKDRTAGQQAQNQTQTWTQDCVTRQTTTAGSYSNCSRGPESVRLVSSWSVRLRAAF